MLDFLGIGAQKCGTTWLYNHLQAHEQLAFPAGKEVHFWDQHRLRGVKWWLDQFSVNDTKKHGEITPAYAILDAKTVREIREAVPNSRLFYSIRNPIARAWSASLMALSRAELMLNEASDRWFMDHFESRGSRQRSDYTACINTWLAVFPQEQLQIIVFDDIVTSSRSVLLGLAKHLAVDCSHFERIAEAELRKPVFHGPQFSIRPVLLEYLRELYRPEIQRLSYRLGRDLQSWLQWGEQMSAA
jgi:hypothetical protein